MTISRRTKIIATMGPALDEPGALERLLAEGVDVLRVNLSHASPADQLARVQRARAICPDIAILADLCGPKLRLGILERERIVVDGETIIFGEGGIPVGDPSLYERVAPGDPVYIADGTIHTEVLRVERDHIVCRVGSGGTIRSRKGINLPNDQSQLPCLTDKDRFDLSTLHVLEPDFVALSYVRHENDIAEVRRFTDLPIVAKIEKQQALDRIDAIVAACDAVMVARGDLGVEIPIERVPASQKKLIRTANNAGKPVITATQMLVSMVSNPIPTRAEVTDIANSVLDGTDAVMLSEETAVGRDPGAAVEMMARVVRETEPSLPFNDSLSRKEPDNAIAYAAAKLAEDLDAVAIIAPTRTGVSAQRLAAFRSHRQILAYSRVPATTRRLRLVWGVKAMDLKVQNGVDPIVATLEAARRDLPAGSRVVLLDIAPRGAIGVPSIVNAITL
ncbi:MAG: pyruvate kinase [Deltaproteobacteria bacterium]|nr:pyruvate kinase [Deltaproteobacteria bacterium]